MLKKIQVHSKAAKQFCSSQPIKELQEGLKNIYDPHIHDLANAPKAHIDLNSAWDTVTIDGLYTLIKCFFPKSDQQPLLKNIKILIRNNFYGCNWKAWSVSSTFADSVCTNLRQYD